MNVRRVRLALALCALALPAACRRDGATEAAGDRSGDAAVDETAQRATLEERVRALSAELADTRARADAERDASRRSIDALKGELDRALTDRVARESEWLRYSKTIASLGALADRATPEFPRDPAADASAIAASGPVGSTEPAPPDASSPPANATVAAPSSAAAAAASDVIATPRGPSPAERALRDHAIGLALRSLFAAERILAFDLLESGTLQDGATGPVVLRTLDEIGRPTGAVCAARLRLESSRAARTLTLVFEDGYERRGTARIPFEAADGGGTTSGGLRRVVLPNVDPAPWIEALPELFGATDKAPIPDDGRWDLGSLRNTLNLLLREDAAGGYWRLAGIGGVRGSVLCDIVLDQLDREGHIERKLFADRLTVLREVKGVQLLLESGAQQKTDRKIPFLDGRYRIFLPRADADAWSRDGVPGLSEPPSPRR